MTVATLAQPLVCTWANRPTSPTNGTLMFASDVGACGTVFQYSTAAGRWRPLNGVAQLASLGAASAAIGSSETVVLQTLLPSGAWQTNDTIRLWLTATKSGATDAGNMSVRIGTAGTTADTGVTGLSAFQLMSGTGLVGAAIFDVKLMAATSAQKMGDNAANVHAYQAASNTAAAAAATVITDASANALYVTLTLASAGATNTVQAASAQIQLIAP